MDFANEYARVMQEIAFVGKRGEGQIIFHVCSEKLLSMTQLSYILTNRSKRRIGLFDVNSSEIFSHNSPAICISHYLTTDIPDSASIKLPIMALTSS